MHPFLGAFRPILIVSDIRLEFIYPVPGCSQHMAAAHGNLRSAARRRAAGDELASEQSMRLRQAALAIGVLWVTTAVAETFTTTESSPGALSSELKSCIEQMISVFENESTSLKYDYIENLHDGRGYTAGPYGFLIADGDLLQVVEVYDGMRPNNVLSAS
jgi:hypothetical protein